MYDVIGDVHGQGEQLDRLLRRLGYVRRGGGWTTPPGRQAVFVGDLIDRGPHQLGVLHTVRSMVDAGCAQLVMGNHEFNAIGYATPEPRGGGHLRPRTPKNRRQHEAFLAEVGEDSARHREWVEWFRTLPMALDLGGLRVVHAWWCDDSVRRVERLRGGPRGRLDDAALLACHADPAMQAARKRLTCGVEMALPDGASITDKEGHRHPDARLAVWRHWARGLREIALVPAGSEHAVPDVPIPDAYRVGPVEGAPIVFGHHWFSGPVRIETPKVACVDWSAARGGPLVAYRWDGEAELHAGGYVSVA